jgi:hypothetical protein
LKKKHKGDFFYEGNCENNGKNNSKNQKSAKKTGGLSAKIF